MQKVSITSDASLWAELAKSRHENFCSPFLRVASVESTRIYEKLVAKKSKRHASGCSRATVSVKNGELEIKMHHHQVNPIPAGRAIS